jgi:hypothetical protein
MPKRLIDDSILNSPSMALLSPRAQDAFPRFILVADDFGCFELHPRTLLARGWPDRTDVSEQELMGWTEEYATKHPTGELPMMQVWAERGRRYCFLTGWCGPHGQRKRVEYRPEGTQDERKGSKRKTPPPPEVQPQVFPGGLPPGSDGFPGGKLPGSSGTADPENINDSLPGREIAGKESFPGREPCISRQKPAHAVPVAVAVPDPVADPVTPPTPQEPESPQAPAPAPTPPQVSPGGERPLQLDPREARRTARLGPTHPAWEAWEHWRSEAWAKIADGSPEPPNTAQALRLADLCGRHGPAEVCARMDRAVADPWWQDKLTLDMFLDRFERFAARRVTEPRQEAEPLSDLPEWAAVLDQVRRYSSDAAERLAQAKPRIEIERGTLVLTADPPLADAVRELYLSRLQPLVKSMHGLEIEVEEARP